MPRAPSDVWIHFTSANVEGKDVYICKYCAKTYVKNATKMQQHIVKCLKLPQGSKQATPGKSSSASIQSQNESDSDSSWSLCSRIAGLDDQCWFVAYIRFLWPSVYTL